MRKDSTSTDRSDNFERRLKQTFGSENDPEMVTPNTAGSEELPEFNENFPLIDTFSQTNMRGRPGGGRSKTGQSGRGRDQS
jgi:hypothetical protein